MKRAVLPEEESSFQMAPMIDMVFLLLIFFMCASTFPELASDRSVELPVASASMVPKNKKNPIIINIHKDGTILWGIERIDLLGITDRVLDQLSRNPEERVYIRADKDVLHRSVREVVAACAKAGASEIIYGAHQTP